MCGRTSCYCKPETYRAATSYFDEKKGKYVKPEWKDVAGHDFKPSANVAPTDFSPILLPGSFWKDVGTSRALQPMMWGLIPSWHKGDRRSHGLSTNNCRIENILGSKLYSPILKKGNRCVIICDGFYEWQTTKNNKQPYFIYSPQPHGIKVEDEKCWDESLWTEEKGWTGPNVLKMAGIFNEWQSPTDEIVFSYTVITMESNKTLDWLHHRMPAILSTEEQVMEWLDVEGTSVQDAIDLLSPVEKISHHPVSSLVNNARNKDPSCNKPCEIKAPNKSSKFMQAWLNKGRKEENEVSAKRVKRE